MDHHQGLLDSMPGEKIALPRINDYYARNAILAILAYFDDAWALQRIDTEMKNNKFYLSFHFPTQTQDSLIVCAQVDPGTGEFLGFEGFRPNMAGEIASAPSG